LFDTVAPPRFQHGVAHAEIVDRAGAENAFAGATDE
jgi:hypothetical protein